jgi:hypothetical protein
MILAIYIVRPVSVFAHAALGRFLEHRVTLSVGPSFIDIEIELMFYADRSMAERRQMDTNRDWAITNAEIGAYRAKLSETLENQLRLTVDGWPVDLVPLYRPELDLMGVDRITPSPHVLRLYCFARTPDWLKSGSVIALEDSLWPRTPGLYFFDITGKDGIRMEAAQAPEAQVTEVGNPANRLLHARCLAVPPASASLGN